MQTLGLPAVAGDKLSKMGFHTVREAFRAALAGRLSARKQGGVKLEDQVLAAAGALLNHPNLNRANIHAFHPQTPDLTIAGALEQFCGSPPFPSPKQAAASIREILLPATQHNSLLACGLDNIAETLATPLSLLTNGAGLSPDNLGEFLALIFDYLFILHDPAPPHANPGNSSSPKTTPVRCKRQAPVATPPAAEMNRERLDALHPLVRLRFRHATGALFAENGQTCAAILAPMPGAAASARYTPTASCEACFPDSHYRTGNCRHLDALANPATLAHPTNPSAQQPQSAWAPGPWSLIAQIHCELFGANPVLETAFDSSSGRWFLQLPGSAATILTIWSLDTETIALVAALFPADLRFQRPPPPAPADPREIAALWARLQELGRDPLLTELNLLRQKSPAQESDESIWMFLGDWLARQIPAHQLRLIGPDPEGLFSLIASSGADLELLRMLLPRAKTPDLVDALTDLGISGLLAPPAHAITRLAMAEEGTVTASPLLRLADGRTLDRQTLDDQRYGRYYHLKDLGFFPVLEQESATTAAQGTAQTVSFSPEQVPKFLKDFSQALADPDNQVDADLQNLDFQETPDHLQVDSFREDGDWCYLAGHYGLGSRRISLNDLLSRRLGNRKYLAGGRHWLKLTDTPLEWFHNLDQSRLWHDPASGQAGVRLTRREMLMLSALMPKMDTDSQVRGRETLKSLLDNDLWAAADRLPPLPAHLREYQRHGVAWLYQLYRNGLAGILADDMGLGKTHQTLALLSLLQTEGDGNSRFLVVCPTTVVPHWTEKIEAFFPGLSHYVHHGSHRDLERAGECNICLTTYGIIRRDSQALNDLHFEVVIFDEVQQLKNKKTDVHRAAARLKGKVVIGLTGTPLENSVQDLKAIFDICLPGYLGSDRSFKSRYADPITEGSDPKPRQALVRLLTPFILRRTRDQVLKELPEIIEDFRTCELSDDQVGLYRELVNGRGRAILAGLDPEERDGRLEYMELLAIINYLKQICNHPCLIKKCDDVSLYRSGKWDLFTELLDECLDAKMKVVIFSHYTTMLDLIENYLAKRGIANCGLRGEMGLATRQKMIKRFNTDPECKVFTASLLTGGIGVDLTAAQAVIHYDRWWNAAREDQATARVHRMGQKHVVQVFKLITVGTLEEKIHRLIARKKDLADQMILQDDSAILKRLTREDLLDLLSVSTE
ncbi:MAG: DEAD/DEAH box helicase [Desulfobulbaceae bacterium]|nr:DEAD/DEAH box helicase [Desulfobulbaceae bacterium]